MIIEHKLRSERVDFIDYWQGGKIEVKGDKLIIEYFFSTYTLDIKEHISSNTLLYDFVNFSLLPKEIKKILEEHNAVTSPQKIYVSRLQMGLRGYDLKEKDVHHLNKNSQYNKSSNLIVFDPEQHKAYHRGEISLSDMVLTLPDKPKKIRKPHKKHISEYKIFKIKKFLLLGKSANYIKKHLKTDKKTIAEIKHENLDQLKVSTHLKQKLKRLKVKISDVLRQIFNFSSNKPKHTLNYDFNSMYSDIICPNCTYNNTS